MPVSFYALITPLAGGRPGVGGGERPDNTLPQPQPPTGGGGGERPDQGLPPFPAHPIVIPPDGIAPGVPTHPIYIPPIPDNSLPPFIQHPIVIPPDAIAPGVPTHPIYLPPEIDNTLPGQQPKPDQGLPTAATANGWWPAAAAGSGAAGIATGDRQFPAADRVAAAAGSSGRGQGIGAGQNTGTSGRVVDHRRQRGSEAADPPDPQGPR